nr:RNA-directed DNA polymerase, eukaryota [Tanacetum cinerariifolium]
MSNVVVWWNVDPVEVNSFEEWFDWLVSIRISSNLKKVLEGVYYGLWWSIWNFRNKILFDNKIPKKTFIFDNLVSLSFNWCFDVLKISYLGELWVLIEFESAKVKDLFKENGGANSWFLVLNQAFEDFTLGGRIAWVEVEDFIMMGDFNEVRYKSERFGSKFKAHDADIFNSFIHNAAIFDYGPIPFRFYNYWLEVDGFDKLVRDAWLNSRGALAKLKEDLRMFDEAIDKGNSPVEMVHKRLETLNKIQQVNNTHMSEVAQKAKIKWVVERDENTKFFL